MKDLLSKFTRLKQMAEDIELQRKDAQRTLVESFKAPENEILNGTIVWEHDGLPIRATLVESETAQINEEGLKGAIGPELWDKITIQKLDMKKLESLVSLGDVDVELVSEYSEVVPRTPYVKISKTKIVEE